MELVDGRRNVIHLVNYSFKWLQLRKLVGCALDSLQEMVVASQQETLEEWFSRLCRSMDEIELKTDYSRHISYSQLLKEYETPQEAEFPEVPDIVKSGFQCSQLSHILKKSDPIILKSQDPEVIVFQDKLQADLDAMTLKQEASEKKLQEQHQENIIRREEFEQRMHKQYEDTKADQLEIQSMVATLLDMMKKQQQQPQNAHLVTYC